MTPCLCIIYDLLIFSFHYVYVCTPYSYIRYGLEALDGYYRYHASINPAFVEDVIQGMCSYYVAYCI